MRRFSVEFVCAIASMIVLVQTPAAVQAPAIPRAPGGKPDLNGIWQVMNTANWDIQDHGARRGDVMELGAAFAVPGGLGVVDGNEIPYRPDALPKRMENAAHWVRLDPEVKCYLPGVPRATYLPYPFQIIQGPPTSDILIAYEFADTTRVIHMNSDQKSPVETWMGWSRGRWEGDTLVVDVTDFNDQTWFDRAGNYHSNELHVVERYTRVGPDRIDYEATIEDPKTFTRPWKMRMPLYRRVEPNARLTEFKCVEFVEDLIFSSYYKK
jgi:hypothetical protein